MRHALIVCAVLTAAAAPKEREEVVTLVLDPQPAPRPLLKHQLLPTYEEIRPGNVVPALYKCFMEKHSFFFGKESAALREMYLTMPLAELPAEEVGNYGWSVLRQADEALRLESLDWQVVGEMRHRGFMTLLSDVQDVQLIAKCLKVRLRGEAKREEFGRAVTTAKSLFAMARAFGRHPTVIASMIGHMHARSTVEGLEELIGRPGCPSLFWAATTLPSPLIDATTALRGERALLAFGIPVPRDGASLSPGQLDKFADDYRTAVYAAAPGGGNLNAKTWLADRAKSPRVLAAARGRLVAAGHARHHVDTWPPLQVVLIDEVVRYEAAHDEYLARAALPWPQAGADKLPRPLPDDARPGPADDPDATFLNLSPVPWFAIKLRERQLQFDQRIAMFRHAEAVRLYAATHDRAPPPTLDAVGLPLPPDPLTGKPFAYSVEGGKATLRGAPIPGDVRTSLRYDITVRK